MQCCLLHLLQDCFLCQISQSTCTHFLYPDTPIQICVRERYHAVYISQDRKMKFGRLYTFEYVVCSLTELTEFVDFKHQTLLLLSYYTSYFCIKLQPFTKNSTPNWKHFNQTKLPSSDQVDLWLLTSPWASLELYFKHTYPKLDNKKLSSDLL